MQCDFLQQAKQIFPKALSALSMLGMRMPVHALIVPVDHSHDLGDKPDMFKNKLLEEYPQLTD